MPQQNLLLASPSKPQIQPPIQRSIIAMSSRPQVPSPQKGIQPKMTWLDIPTLAKIEVSSADDLFPIDHAFLPTPTTGWRAATTGPQTLRLIFHTPQPILHIHIHITDRVAERMQQFTLIADGAVLLRQQFTFSPHGTTEEIEDYTVDLHALRILELQIDPDRAHIPANSQHFATLTALRLA